MCSTSIVWEVHLPRVCRLVPDFFTCLAQGAFNVFNQYGRFIYPECRLVPDFFMCPAQGAFNVFNEYDWFIYPECAG